MKKNLQIINTSNKLMLKKSKSLMSITNSILSKDDWMQRLWDWADKNNIPDIVWNEEYEWWDGFPRDKEKLLNQRELILECAQLEELPKEIGNLTNLTLIELTGNELTELPKEIGNLTKLDTLFLIENKLTLLPKEIINLTNLKVLEFVGNSNLVLTVEQQKWIFELIKNGCDVTLNDRYKNLYGEFELARRYKYLDEFNIGREVPITPEILDEIIPYAITEKLAKGEITFEEYLAEASEYLAKGKDKDKFYEIVKKLYDRDYNLGICFEKNITFVTFQDNKVTWHSIASAEDEKILSENWGLINMFVKDTFGFETKIINRSKK